jgi:hypothetical protein
MRTEVAMFRYIVHPKSITATPKRLSAALGAQGLQPYPAPNVEPHYAAAFFIRAEDLFLIYPTPQYVREGASAEYTALYEFFSRHKFGQRRRLQKAELPIPDTIGRRGEHIPANPLGYIVRPLRHSGGRHYRRTHNPADFVEGEEYLSAVFPKNREFRVICCRGERVVTLEKHPPAGAGPAEAWNYHAGASFRSIADAANDPLAPTKLYERIREVPFLRLADLLGIDVMMAADGRYALLEVNTCPGLAIANNLRAVVECLRSLRA